MFTERVFGKDATISAADSAVPLDRQIADSGLIVDAVMHSINTIEIRIVADDPRCKDDCDFGWQWPCAPSNGIVDRNRRLPDLQKTHPL